MTRCTWLTFSLARTSRFWTARDPRIVTSKGPSRLTVHCEMVREHRETEGCHRLSDDFVWCVERPGLGSSRSCVIHGAWQFPSMVSEGTRQFVREAAKGQGNHQVVERG